MGSAFLSFVSAYKMVRNALPRSKDDRPPKVVVAISMASSALSGRVDWHTRVKAEWCLSTRSSPCCARLGQAQLAM